MNARIGMLALVCIVFPISAARGATLHVDVTPELAGEDGFNMTPIDGGRTRFSIRRDTSGDPTTNESSPFVRRARLEIYGDDGLLVRCPVAGSADKLGHLFFIFELHDQYAKSASFIITEFEDNKQVGGGANYSYRLLDFIDPDHQTTELTKRIRQSVDLSTHVIASE